MMNALAHCRIGRVRLRGGCEVRPLHAVAREKDVMRDQIVKDARIIAGFKERPDGFVILAWYDDGTYTTGWRIEPQSLIGPTMLPAFFQTMWQCEGFEPKT